MQNMPAGNIDVYYHHSKKECKIYFVDAITGKDLPPVDGIEHVINNQTLTPGTKAEHFNGDAPVDPSGELYFVGWFYDQGGANPYSFDDEIPGDTIVHAVWRPNLPTEYKIRHVLVDENGKEIKHKKGIGEFPDAFFMFPKIGFLPGKALHFLPFCRIIGARRLRLPQWTGPVFFKGVGNMRCTDLIFDLYGTLVDIHTEENDTVWEKTAVYFGFYGAHYTPRQLKDAFQSAMASREAQAGQSYECFPDIPFEDVMAELFRGKGVEENADALGVNAAQLFRICSLDYIRLYPGVLEALAALRAKGFRLWLLSNAQHIFTAYELNHLGLGSQLDGIRLSSDYRCRKPDLRFFRALVEEEGLDPTRCLMIGNDRQTDIAGAMAAGLDTLYLHTGLTPAEQAPADPDKALGTPGCSHFEYEGSDWYDLVGLLCRFA